MLQKLNRLLGCLMVILTGGFAGMTLTRFLDFKKHPDLYAVQSAPWYSGVLVDAVITGAALTVCLGVRIIIKRRLRFGKRADRP